MPKKGSCCIGFSIILLDSIYEMDRISCSQVFFRRVQIPCKRIPTERIIEIYVDSVYRLIRTGLYF